MPCFQNLTSPQNQACSSALYCKSHSACLFKIETVNTLRANQETSVQCRWCLRLMLVSQNGYRAGRTLCAHFWLHLWNSDIPNITHSYSSNFNFYKGASEEP